MSSKSQYLKKMHKAVLQGFVDDLVKGKMGGKAEDLKTLRQPKSNA
jgi:hypothetical protein